MSAVDRRGRITNRTGDPDADAIIESLNDLDDTSYGLVTDAIVGMTVGRRLEEIEARQQGLEDTVALVLARWSVVATALKEEE